MASIQVDENEFCPLRRRCRSHCSALLPLVTHPESSKNLKQQHQEILATLVVVQRWLLKRFLREHCLHWTVLVNLKYASDIKTRKCKFLFFFTERAICTIHPYILDIPFCTLSCRKRGTPRRMDILSPMYSCSLTLSSLYHLPA